MEEGELEPDAPEVPDPEEHDAVAAVRRELKDLSAEPGIVRSQRRWRILKTSAKTNSF